jgi:hypothetical protein
MSDQTGASWLSETRSKLRHQSEAIAEALDDLAATLGDRSDRGPATWVKLQHGESVTVYVLTPRLLHRFSGKPDPPTGSQPDEPRESACEYRTFPITPYATFWLSVTVKAAGEHVRTVDRHWTFRIGDDPGQSIDIATSTKKQDVIDDPTLFARALAATVAAVSATPADA